MPVALFDERFSELAVMVRLTRSTLNTFIGQSGQMPVRNIQIMADYNHRLMVAATRAVAELDNDPDRPDGQGEGGYSSANAALSRRPGWPRTGQALIAAVDALTSAVATYEAATLQMFEAMPNGWVQRSMVDAETGVSTGYYEQSGVIPQAYANAWRGHASITGLRAALSSAGG